MKATYPKDDDHFVVDTDLGAVRITAILFDGQLSVREFDIPIASVTEYRRDDPEKPIAQTATFPVEIQGTQFSLEMHNLADTGETHVLLRKISKE